MYSSLLVLVGAIVGVLARFIGPGRPPSSLLGSMFFGIAGAIVGQFVARLTGFSSDDGSAAFLAALVGAVLHVVLYHAAVLPRTAR